MAAIALLGALWSGLPLRRSDQWNTLLAHACHRLTKLGLTLPPVATPRQMAQQAQARWGDDAARLNQWLLDLEQCHYSGSPDKPKVERLSKTWRMLPWAKYEVAAPHRPKS
jgi:hypothetical protein